MKLKTLALASAAVMALSSGAFAKAHHVAKSDSQANAQEAVITQQLNQQQLSSPGTLPTAQETTQSSDQMTMNSMSSNATVDQSATDNTTPKMAAGDTSKSSGTANSGDLMKKDSTAPTTDLGKATTAAGNEIDQASMVKNPVTPSELKSAVAVSKVPSETLKTAEVKNRAGEALGEVQAVGVDSSGRVASINADVGGFLGVGQRVVSLDANKLVYVKSRNLIVTNMTKDEIGKLPPVIE